MSEVLTQFLEKTKTRIPTVEEMLSVCDDLNIQFKIIEGKPYMKPCPTCIDEAKVLAKLFKREPFRSKVLQAKLPGIEKPNEPEKADEHECLWPGTGYIGPHSFPQSGWPSGAYFYRKVGDTEWLPIPGRTWNAETKRGTIEKGTT